MKNLEFDFLVVGSGIAGLFYALKISEAEPEAKIAIVTKKSATDTNTNRAQGGIAAVLSKTDSFKAHVEDTLLSGAGLCRRKVVEEVVRTGPEVVERLVAYGVRFSQEGDHYSLGREGGHSASRVLHAADLTGREIERALLSTCRHRSHRITILRDHIVVDLILEGKIEDAVCSGALVFSSQTGRFQKFRAPVTMLATGGLGQVYYHNTNPKIATGDGTAIAHRAGVSVGNLEFVQFHPTVLYNPGRWPFLISEAVRGEGAFLVSTSGRRLMKGAHELEDLAPRDIVARQIDRHLKESGDDYVLLDISHRGADFIKNRFPNIYKECLRRGFDMTKRPIPVVPAAHYSCGGVVADIEGSTSLPGLFVAGEVAMTGMHGANRLASNSLLEAVVMAEKAVAVSSLYFRENKRPADTTPGKKQLTKDRMPRNRVMIAHDRRELRQLMSDFVGIVRSSERLNIALKRIEDIRASIEERFRQAPANYGTIELRNLATVAELIVRSALKRKESRGLHYVEDYPETDLDQNKDTIIEGELSDPRVLRNIA